MIAYGGFVFARVELLEVELAFGSFGRPQAEIVRGCSLIAWDWDIVRDCIDNFAALPDCNILAVFIPVKSSVKLCCVGQTSILVSGNMAIELNVYSDIVPRKFPRVKVQPIVWYLYLISVDDFLLEDAISITQTIAPGGIVQRSHTVKKTRSQPAESAVTESSVMFLRYNILDSESEVFKPSYMSRSIGVLEPTESDMHTSSHVLQANVEHGIIQSSSHQKLQR